MTDKNNDRQSWELEQLTRKVYEIDEVQKKHVDELSEFRTFKATTVDKLLLIFTKLEEIQENDRTIRKVFITALVGAVLSAITSLIVWAFTT